MHDITKGELTVDGVDVDSLRGKELRRYRRKVGMIFQSFNLVSRSTAIKNVLTADVPDMPFFKVLLGIFSKEQKMRALESLDKVGILDKAYTRCDQLSGGQQQRVALARTLNQNPKIILADEPVASLDPITAKQVMEDFVRINKEYNISILLNIHHVDLALKYCDRVIGVRAGEIVFDGPASTITQEQIDELHRQSEQEQARLSELEALTEQSRMLHQEFAFHQEMIESFASAVNSATLEEKRRLLRTIVKKVVWDGKNAYVYLFAEDGELNLPPIGQLMCPSGEDSE